ncbi:unnamed protein product [Toxocara canis]|nr:unnamed protein product [Toxocara canis]
MGTGHRAIIVWVQLLLVLVFLVIYLDGGLDREPSIFFVLLWLFDLVSLALIGVRVIRHYNLFAAGRRGFDPNNSTGLNNHFPVVFPLDKRGSALAATLLILKAFFEVLLFIRLKMGVIRPFWIMIPLWIFLVIAITELTRRLMSIHNKATASVSR